MDFVPSWKDYLLLCQFVGLFSLSGWLTYWFVVGRFQDCVKSDAPSGKQFDLFKSLISPALLSTICGLVVTSCFLIVSAQLGVARVRYLLLLLALYSLVVFFILLKKGYLRVLRTGRYRLEARWPPQLVWNDLWLVGILLVGLFVFGKTTEYVASQRDPGEYANIAVRLAQEKGLRFFDPDFQDFDLDRQKLFLPVLFKDAYFLEAVPGFSLLDAETGEMLPQYLHLFPLWLSLAFKLWRFDGLFGFNVLLGILSLLLLVALAVEVFRSKTIGLIAATLLCLNLGQIWLVRSPFSETLAQVFLLAGVWMLTVVVSRRQSGLGFLTGLVFGLSLMVRIDSVLAILSVALFLVLVGLGPVRLVGFPIRSIVAGMGAGITYSLVHIALFAYPYVLGVLFNQGVLSFFDRQWIWLFVLALLAGVMVFYSKKLIRLMGFWLGSWVFVSRLWAGSRTRHEILFVSLSGLVCVAFVYGYFLRPMLDLDGNFLPLSLPHEGAVPYYDELNLVRLGWYLTPLGICLAFLGVILMLRQVVLKGQVRPLPFLLLFVVFLLFYGYKSRAFPDNYWVIRRYAEVTIPALLILAGLVIQRFYRLASSHPRLAARSASRRLLLQVGVAGLLIAMIATQTVAAWPFLRQGELEGTWVQMARLASRTEEADLILFEHGRAQEFFVGPLRNLFGQSVLPLSHNKPDPASFERVVSEYLRANKRVFLISCDEWTSLVSSKYFFQPNERFYFNSFLVEQTYERLPEKMQRVRYSLQLYEIKPRPQERSKPYQVLNRHSSFGYASKGFYQPELGVDGNTFRWSRGNASVELPEIDVTHPAVLIVRLARGNVEAPNEFPVRIYFNGHDLGPLRLSSRFNEYKFSIDRLQLAQGKNNLMEIRSQAFHPLAMRNGEDTRDLGFMLDCIKLQSLIAMGGTDAYQVELGAECEGIQHNDFYPAEVDGYSWTGLAPRLVWPVPLSSEKDYQLVIRTVKSSPDPKFRQFLTVWANETKLDTKELIGVGEKFQDYVFPISSETIDHGSMAIRFQVNPIWNPSLSGVSSDYRNLGCAVQWIRIEQL